MLNAVRIWVLLSALLVAVGWLLSALHQLNPSGYAVFGALAMVALVFWRSKNNRQPGRNPAPSLQKFLSRFKRPLPLIFLAMAALTLLGGLWYAPSNGSSIAYRIPRVMHWLTAGQWHWVYTADVRMNIAGCGMEWLFAPLILLTHNDRLLFLPNWLSFLLLPGLTFSVFIRLGVRPRVAWWWMWLLPSGWCFIMQANSTINDAFGAAYALAALDFALRAREEKKISHVWFALLAAALATGVKQTDVLLALPALVALLPSARLVLQRPVALLAIGILCAVISALPMMILDSRHAGSWSGVSANSWDKAELHSPFWGLAGNVFCLAIQNFKPPVFPFTHAWNDARHHFLQTPFGSHFTDFEDFGRLSFGASETSSGIGMGISVLVVLSWLAAWFYRRARPAANRASRPDCWPRVLCWLPWGLLLVFMAKVGTFENGRQLAAYYIFLFPLLLSSTGQSALVRKRWWRFSARFVMGLAVLLLVISRDRPLFPAQSAVHWLTAKHPNSSIARNIGLTYGRTPDYERQRLSIREILPPAEKIVGYAVDGGDMECALWLPFGAREVQDVIPSDTLEQLQARGIHCVLVESIFLSRSHDTIEQWLARQHGTVLKQWQFLNDPYEPPVQYYLVRLPG